MRIKNYHKQSIKYENEYEDELLVIFSGLLNNLNDIDNLSKTSVVSTLAEWKRENKDLLDSLNRQQVKQITEFTNTILPGKLSNTGVDKYTRATNNMLDVTTDYIKDKFIELSVLEGNYNYSPELSTKFLRDIARHTEDKLALLATMTYTAGISTLLTDNAIDEGYTEYQWHTQRDNRVRPAHAHADGKWFSLFEAPKLTNYYHAGQDYGCRCWMSDFR